MRIDLRSLSNSEGPKDEANNPVGNSLKLKQTKEKRTSFTFYPDPSDVKGVHETSFRVLKNKEVFKFPVLTGDCLVGGSLELPNFAHGKISLVALCFKQIGYEQIVSWIDPFEGDANQARSIITSDGHTEPPFQAIQVSVMQGGFLAGLIKGSLISGMLKVTPSHRQARSEYFY